jgi:hypothetical protein
VTLASDIGMIFAEYVDAILAVLLIRRSIVTFSSELNKAPDALLIASLPPTHHTHHSQEKNS